MRKVVVVVVVVVVVAVVGGAGDLGLHNLGPAAAATEPASQLSTSHHAARFNFCLGTKHR